MNRKQKAVTWVALAGFSLSVLQAPWEQHYEEHHTAYGGEPISIPHSSVVYGPVWTVPSSDLTTQPRLLWLPLMATWTAILVIYAGLFLLLKTKQNPS